VTGEARECSKVFGTVEICVGDTVEIYPRGLKSLVHITGRVEQVGDSALVITSTGENHWVIRYSEIRMIRIVKSGAKPQ